MGLEVGNWNGKVVREFVQHRFGLRLTRSYFVPRLRRLGFVLTRPKKRFLKADAEQRETLVREYAAMEAEAGANGATILFADEAHFRADADLRGVDSPSPSWGEKASYSSAVCVATGEVDVLELAGASTAQTSTAFLQQIRASHSEPLIVLWDNGPAHRGEAIRSYLAPPNQHLRLINLPAYSPEFNADEAIWKWAPEEVTANTCLGAKAKVKEKVGEFFRGLAERAEEVQQRCRTRLHEQAAMLRDQFAPAVQPPACEASPEIPLASPHSPLADALNARDLPFRLYRRVIEIRDGELALRLYAERNVVHCAQEICEDMDIRSKHATEAVEAASLVAAASGESPGTTCDLSGPHQPIRGGADHGRRGGCAPNR